jgi:hypothetical protein
MGTDQGEPAAADSGLQFDQVEHAAPEAARACARCTRQIADEYYEIGGQVVCASCARELGGGDGGAGPFLRALGYGAGAALIGTVVWYLIVKITDYEIGLLAVGVGLLIGFAVRKGSRARGGWKYQLLAIALTYASITASKIPFILQAVKDLPDKAAAAAARTDVEDKTKTESKTPAPAVDAPKKPVTVGGFLFACVLLFGFALASPFLAGASNIIGILIIGIALYEAWKMNRRLPINGPFRLGATPAT